MGIPTFVKGKPISLKSDPRFDENWVKDRIKEDPSIVGLGNLELKSVERIQKGGFLDLLLVDDDEDKWFEVEVQLGPTDPSHIIRTIEYWDYEQRHFPNHKHCAVLIAEDVTTRFLNVIALFNRQIPIMAIQMKAIELQGQILLHFTRVLDTEETEEDDEDEVVGVDIPTTSIDWEKKSSVTSMQILKECTEMLQELNADIKETYKQGGIGLTVSGKVNNFLVFYPKKQSFVTVHARPKKREEWAERLRDAGINVLSTGTRSVRFRLKKEDLAARRDLLKQLFSDAYEHCKE
jgi:hypothetical protein